MRAQDIQQAADDIGAHPSILCIALREVIPLLERLKENASGWKFWLKWALGVTVGALKAWRDGACGRPPGV